MEADLGHPVVGGGDVAHRRPQDAPAAVARADDRDVERLARLVVLGDPVHQLLARLPVRLVDQVERGGQQVGVGDDLRVQPLAGLGHVGVQGLPTSAASSFPSAPASFSNVEESMSPCTPVAVRMLSLPRAFESVPLSF